MNKIFSIDDDAIALMYCTTLIKKNFLNTEVLVAAHGQEAIKYYAKLADASEEEKANYPKLIFLDLNMPVMNGWEFLDDFMKSYYSIFPKTKVVILSSSLNPVDQVKAKSYESVIRFCSKPLSNQMLEEIKKLL